jgi:hypothetical protein
MKFFLSLATLFLVGRDFLNGQGISLNSNRERNFVFEVKQIDEFFERFNNEKNTLFSEYVAKKYPGITIDRHSLVRSLFNRENQGMDSADRKTFIAQVTDSSNPVFLDFSSNQWYAAIDCRFKHLGKFTDVALVLKIQQESNGGMKWVIVSAFTPQLRPESNTKVPAPRPNPSHFLNPMSQATDFMDLADAFDEGLHTRDYLDSSFYRRPFSIAFLRSLSRQDWEFQYVRRISYHFFQVQGWEFTVSYFQRNSANSGWLISSLKKVTPEEKESLREKLFQKSL